MRVFRVWLQANDVLALKTQGGAESLAYDLALRMTAARTISTALSGLALDLSKCYDQVHIGILAAIVERAGIPAAITGPILSAYRQPRVVRFGSPAMAFRLAAQAPLNGWRSSCTC